VKLLHPQVAADLSLRWYRYRFLASYIAIGALSLVLEVGVLRTVEGFGAPRPYAAVAGIVVGVLVAYYLNARFNFQIPAAKRTRAFRYFVIISAFSLALNWTLKARLAALGWSYERSRFTSSAVLFLVAYALHRRFSFHDRKQLGIAVYVDRAEDIRGIWEKVGVFPNFIHLDLVDESVKPGVQPVAANRAEVARAFWPDKPLHVHIMSKTPSRWLPDVLPYCDVVIVHLDLDEPLGPVLDAIRAARREAGLCLRTTDSPEALRPWLGYIQYVLLLAIAEPGRSGQEQDPRVRAHVQTINGWRERELLTLCVDGGVNERTITQLDVEHAVSASSVLNNPDPKRQILRLQTGSAYDAT